VSDFSRKDFLTTIGTVGAGVGLPVAASAQTAPVQVAQTHEHAPAKRPARKPAQPLTNEPEAYTFFSEPEWKFVEAAVERLIPADAHNPGAFEAGVAFYIDQQLAGAYGLAAKMYKRGPWNPSAAPEYGYQLALTPQQVYRLGIAATNAYCRKTHGKTFDALSPANQDEVLNQLDQSKLSFDAVPAKAFFEMLLASTVEGFFADPLYGGNRDKIGWKLVGFPGAAAAYIGLIERHNVAYNVTPVGISELQKQEEAMADMHMAMDEMQKHEEIARRALGVKK
jgi:gluconate 2-dehydrogenase gamma chain